MSIWFDGNCSSCGVFINQTETGEPVIQYKGVVLCSDCAISLIEPIYYMLGTGGIQHIIFRSLLSSSFNRKQRRQLPNYKKVFQELLYKYKFQCVHCGEKEEKKLTIDHIHPVAKGGVDEINNLQILCKSCNSRKGAKTDEVV